MVQRTIDQFYPTYAEAVQVVADLTSIRHAQPANVSLIESEDGCAAATGGRGPTVPRRTRSTTGATLGAAIGGGLGALAGVGAISIPYTDALVATGWVLPCVTLRRESAGSIGAADRIAMVRLAFEEQVGAHVVASSNLQRGQQLVMVRMRTNQ